MSPLWSDMAIASALKAAAAARSDADRDGDDAGSLQRVGHGWTTRNAARPARRPIRKALASCAL